MSFNPGYFSYQRKQGLRVSKAQEGLITMTRFVSEALGVRSGRRRSTYTNAELRRNMQRFLDTGEHPDVEASREARRHLVVARLPDANTTRAHVFLDVALNGSPAGR